MDPRIVDAYGLGETIAWTGGDVAVAFADRDRWATAEKATLALLTA